MNIPTAGAGSSRQRMLDAFKFNNPDKIPVVYHPSPAGLHVQGRKLLDLFKAYPSDNPVSFDSIPAPPPHTIADNGRYHEIKKDDWGTEWEYLIFGVNGHPRRYPFGSWEEAEDFQFPAIRPIPPADIARMAEHRKRYLLFNGWVSLFEKLHALRPMDEVLMDLQTRDPHLMSFLDRLEIYWEKVIAEFLGVGIDVIVFGDDWGMQSATIISPALFREIFMPRYRRLIAPIKKAGRMVFFHSCGFLGEILDDLFDLGINGLWPQITLYQDNPQFPANCKEHRVAVYLHPDRQKLIPLGTPREIENAIRIYADRYHRLNGGGIFYVEIENDAPFENVEALIKSIHKFR